VLAIDPGRERCGLAVLEARTGRVLARRVVPVEVLVEAVRELMGEHRFARAVVGDRTGFPEVARLLRSALGGLEVVAVEEAGTTLEARRLYFADHPPSGWRRLLPRSLQVPPVAYDDYSAVALGRRYLDRERREIPGSTAGSTHP
jgi:RNase H-fold protein (predicted Holliday junction resolvase)